jgi:hypothetical protein
MRDRRGKLAPAGGRQISKKRVTEASADIGKRVAVKKKKRGGPVLALQEVENFQ